MRTLLARGIALLLVAGIVRGEEIWRLDNLEHLDAHRPTVVGRPTVATTAGLKAMNFDGANDGLFIGAIPFAGAKQFTIEILFLPLEGGLPEQRFFHAQDNEQRRALLETRLDGKGHWWIDTFIVTGAENSGVTLANAKNIHPTGQWYWAALRYDGETMSHYINGQKELERRAVFTPFTAGQISLGVRQNKVFWFKGAIREVRFHREALPIEKLQHTPR